MQAADNEFPLQGVCEQGKELWHLQREGVELLSFTLKGGGSHIWFNASCTPIWLSQEVDSKHTGWIIYPIRLGNTGICQTELEDMGRNVSGLTYETCYI